MGFLHPSQSPWLLASLALFVAFLSATQDIAVDAYRTEMLSDEERGMGAAMYHRWLSTRIVSLQWDWFDLADKIGWHQTILLWRV